MKLIKSLKGYGIYVLTFDVVAFVWLMAYMVSHPSPWWLLPVAVTLCTAATIAGYAIDHQKG